MRDIMQPTPAFSLPTPLPTPVSPSPLPMSDVSRRPQRLSAANASNNISALYVPKGMLDSQEDSQAWLDHLKHDGDNTWDISNTAASQPNDTAACRPNDASNSSDVEIIESEPPLKRMKLDVKPPLGAVSVLRKHVDTVALRLEETWAERCQLEQELDRVQKELARVNEELGGTLEKLREAESDNHHLRLIAIHVGEKLIDHGPGKVKCFCIKK
ncbi:hypothetical protein DXG01_003831 [Tephrocybe rancida]|nr:hypothetical protein DXG01_003831 [Tephrocybe rancida]